MEPSIWIRVVQVVIFFTLVCGFAFQAYRANVMRQWDLRDREEAKRELEARLSHIEATTIERQQQVVAMVKANANKLTALTDQIISTIYRQP